MKKTIAAALLLALLLCGCGRPGYTSYWDVITDPDTSLRGAAGTEQDETPPDFDYLDTSAAGIITREMENSIDYSEEPDPGSDLGNAIVENTYVSIIEDSGDSCTVKITYPDVASAIIEAEATLPQDADREDLDELLADIANKVRNGEMTTLEGTYTLPIIVDEAGVGHIRWSSEALDAMSGGIARYIMGGAEVE